VVLSVVKHVRRMRGGAQSHLMRCSNGNLYVVKFQNNPQHIRVLANEMLGTRLADAIGLPVPETAIVEVGEELIESTPQLTIQLTHTSVKCKAGVHFGSRYVLDPVDGQLLDYMPAESFDQVRNVRTFGGILALDKWTGNTDGRQATFWRKSRERKYSASFIDQGYCFNAEQWTFPDFPLRGVYARNEAYEFVRGWDSFEPWLTRIEKIDEDVIWTIMRDIPSAWYNDDSDSLLRLGHELITRRKLVRRLIEAFRMSPRRPFPLWTDEKLINGSDLATTAFA
jgi:hypothetical protein